MAREKCIAMYVENIKTTKIVIISACPHNCSQDKNESSLTILVTLTPSSFSPSLLSQHSRIINDIRNSPNMYRRESEARNDFGGTVSGFFWQESHIRE